MIIEFIKEYANRVKELIRNEEDMYHGDLEFELQHLEEKYWQDYETESDHGQILLEGRNVFNSLVTKLERIHPLNGFGVVRDPETHLAQMFDLGFGYYVPEYPYDDDEDTFYELQKDLTLMIQNRSICDPDDDDPDPDFTDVVLNNKQVNKLEDDDVRFIVNALSHLSAGLIRYIDYYKTDRWNWRADCVLFSQYIFEKAVELTYKVYKGEDTDELMFNINDIFKYYEVDVPEKLLYAIDNKVENLENLVYAAEDYIKKKDMHLCSSEFWLNPFFIYIGVIGMKFVLEQEDI